MPLDSTRVSSRPGRFVARKRLRRRLITRRHGCTLFGDVAPETLKRVDQVLLVVLLPAWLLCALLSARTLIRPSAHSPLYVDAARSAAEYPVVTGFWDTSGARELQLGDQLLRFGERDLRGIGRLATYVSFAAAAHAAGGPVEVEYEREGVLATALVAPYSNAGFRGWLPAGAIFVLSAVFILRRTGGTPLGRALFLSFMACGFQLAIFFAGGERETYSMIAARSLALGLATPLTLRAFQRFPDDQRSREERLPETPFSRTWPWLFALAGLFHAGRFGLMPHQIAVPTVLALTVGGFIALLWILSRRYQREDPLGRRRIRWVVFGVYAAVLPPLIGNALATWDDRFTVLYTASLVALGLIPLSVLISIFKVDLFDVDRALSSTVAWNLLLVVGVGAMIVLMPFASQAGSSWLQIEPPLSRVLVAALLLTLLVPRQARVRAQVEKQLFAERYALDRGAAQLQQQLSEYRDARKLIERLGRGLSELFAPESCAVFARHGDAFLPVFTAGRPHAPFPATGPLARTLAVKSDPFAVSREDGQSLDPFDRAALESLAAAVLVPIVQDDKLRLVVCLGERTSGDVYTPTDRNLLSMLASHTSTQLIHCDQAELIDQLHERSAALQRFVPSAIAAQIARGESLKREEREVTVLFVDIRGYTRLAEELDSEETYSMVTAFVETATEAVHQRGGHQVDFRGDCIMAVFGAPEGLEKKESVAVDVALEIVARAPTIGVPPDGVERGPLHAAGSGSERPEAPEASQEDRDPLALGIGIATGPAFTGDMRSADHDLWVVIGNTTNRAARLQELTRTFKASIALDAATVTAQGVADRVHLFEKRPAVELKGFEERVDVWVLPLPPPAGEAEVS